VHVKCLHIKLHIQFGLVCILQAFESEVQCRSGAVVKTDSQSRYSKKFDAASVDSDEPFANLIRAFLCLVLCLVDLQENWTDYVK